MKWTLDRVAAISGGEAHGSAVATSVTIDSRHVPVGALFVAIRGEHQDGHAYLDDALEAGATGVVAERGRRGDRPGVEVDDTKRALLELAVARRAELICPVIGITGSSGKTTTKDFTRAALGGTAHSSPRSFNNEFGVPLTVLGTSDDSDALVVEVGSRGQGHIAALAPAIRPSVSVITNIGRAHLEMFGDVDGVAAAKWELVEALGPDGVAVLPAGETRLEGRDVNRALTFGEAPGADVRVSGVRLDDAGRAAFDLHFDGSVVAVELGVPGRHQPLNAAAAVAAAVAAGRPFADAASRLGDADVSQWRMETTSIPVTGGSATVVNDSYNSNPDSLDAALDTVASMPGRHIAVLGKMYELGGYEADAHRTAGARAHDLGFVVVVVGEDPGIAAGAGSDAMRVADTAAAAQWLRDAMLPGDVVLIKASRAAGFETIAADIQGVTP